jgi:hypothetical protein
MTLRLFTMTSAIVAVVAFSLPAMAEAPLTDLSSQSIQVGPGGVRVGHDRHDSRRRDGRDRFESRGRDRRDRDESRGRGGEGRGCKTVTVRERLPGGGVKITKRSSC